MSDPLKTIELLKVYVPEVKSTLEYRPTINSRAVWHCECRDLQGIVTHHRLISLSYFADIYRRFKNNPNTTIEHDKHRASGIFV